MQGYLKKCSLVSLLAISPFVAAQKLVVDLDNTSISGLSSGGYMATQFQFAHAETLVGAGIVAAGPYYCAQNSISTALSECVTATTDALDPQVLLDYVSAQQAAGNLADEEALKQQNVFLLHGTLDAKINPKAANLLHAQYQSIGVNNLKFVNDKAFPHLLPTLSNGVECTESASPFIGACDYDAAGEMLKFIYPDLGPKGQAKKENLITFAQNALTDIKEAEMGEKGFVYVPDSCQQGETCSVHISLHGCNQNQEDVGDAYAWQSGYNDWAESNHLIVLYPQTKKSKMFPLNPQGCWDWWGYTGSEFATKQGKQITAIYNLLNALTNIDVKDL
ncbi:extracellular catalytic domain type 2 short-chain-length polyhydroxyalkanoate depolymerase [Glaciecola sp. 1036]|uniref:extracellular catalytic domain type 2 short-chain-length polyhydroxyalkanoate depolymerase n=1 Tax=Alteromonadaceae TaxID=72275 RepID=UPI003D0776B2